ncbi:glycogen debranching protein, partial [candidate division KSB1 bacterium]
MNSKKRIRLFSTDLDGTFLDEPDALTLFRTLWSKLGPKNRPLLCYNSGRLLDDIKQLVSMHILPEPDYIISGVGTSIYDYKKAAMLKEFAEILEEGWDNSLIDK